MRILVIQLGRLGDIFQSIPALIKYKKDNRFVKIDLLVRDKFKEACFLCDVVDKIYTLNSATILKPSLVNENIDGTVDQMESFLNHLYENQYDAVYDLSFSPLSSYIGSYLEIKNEGLLYQGYSRFKDGTFRAKGDESSYVYSQIGVNKFNRVHLVDIFSAQLDAHEWHKEIDFWREKQKKSYSKSVKYSYCVIHIGGSQKNKSIRKNSLIYLLKEISSRYDGKVILVGSNEEKGFADQIVNENKEMRLVNKLGETSLQSLCSLIIGSDFVVGPDSSVINLSSLLGKKSLSLSTRHVRFWETGPWSDKSFVVSQDETTEIFKKKIIAVIKNFINDEDQSYLTDDVYYFQKGEFTSYEKRSKKSCYKWNLIKSLYFGKDFPVSGNKNVFHSLKLLYDSLDIYVSPESHLSLKNEIEVLSIIDSSMETVEKECELLRPLIWYHKEQMIKIPPESLGQMIIKTKKCMNDIHAIVKWMLFLETEEIGLENLSLDQNQSLSL